MKIAFLETLIAVIRHGSFAAAAPEVNLTASAVGLQMKQLEAYFGQPLFDRSARHVRPTELAREIAATVAGTLDTLESLRSRVDVSVSGHVRVGIIESAQIAMLPGAIKALRAFAPMLEVQFTRGVSQYLLQELKAGRLDAAVVVRPETGGSSRLHWMTLREESFVLVAPTQSRGNDPRALLQAYEWIRLDRSATGGKIAAAYVEKMVPGKRSSLDLPGTDAIVAMVAAGVGVSIIPATRPEIRRAYAFREIGLGHEAPVREVALVCRVSDAENRRVQAVHRAFEKAVQA